MHARRYVAAVFAAPLVFGLAACGATNVDTTSNGETRVVETVRGEVTMPDSPQRVVVLDSQSVDVLSSLGVDPVAYDIGAGESLDTLPWLVDAVEGEFAPGLVGTDSKVDFEAVLEADPDLIIADHWTAEGETFKRLNEIAPTITSDVEEAVSWQDRTTFLAGVLGIREEGEKVISDTEAAIAEATSGLAALEGETYEYIAFSQEQGGFWYGNGTWMEDFGLVAAEGQNNTHEDMAIVSLENMTDFTADVIGLWPMTDDDRAAVEGNALFAELPAVKEGKLIWLDYALAVATNVPGPLSTIYTVEAVVPQLTHAVAD